MSRYLLLILIVEILLIKMPQVLWEIDPVSALQLGSCPAILWQIAAGRGIFKTEDNRIAVRLGKVELQRIVPERLLN